MNESIKLNLNFYLEELIRSDLADRFHLNNEPDDQILIHLTHVASWLQEVRGILGNNIIHISSGYRSPSVNKKAGGSKKSNHMKGLSVDWSCPGFGNPNEIVSELTANGVPYFKMINEFNRWVHSTINLFNAPGQGTLYNAIKKNGKIVYLRRNV